MGGNRKLAEEEVLIQGESIVVAATSFTKEVLYIVFGLACTACYHSLVLSAARCSSDRRTLALVPCTAPPENHPSESRHGLGLPITLYSNNE